MQITTPQELNQLQKDCLAEFNRHPRRVLVCCGPGCLANGAQAVSNKFVEVLKRKKRIKDFSIEALKETGCHGFCEMGPLVVIEPDGTFYTKVRPVDVEEIVETTIRNGEIVERLLYTDPKSGRKIANYHDIDFYKHQQRIALRNIGRIRQCDIREYVALGGYQALAKALTGMKPKDVIDKSLHPACAAGGGGFPTGRKWSQCARADETPRYVICNGDEGDPGAFMDRAIMEGDPHSVLEGMIIAAYAVGANQGYVYVREEYPLAVVNIQKAIEQAREYGFLGKDIFDSGFSFDIKVSRGGGAFVCGESSALMKSVAGEVGEPRAKYVRSVIKGLFDKPTVLNNVESYANVPVIIDKGSAWFSHIGTPKSTGTKAFSLVGKVRNGGLIEVPMGTSLRRIVYDIGGGILEDRPFKAVQTGGPSGGCLPEEKLDLSVDFDTLTKAGSMMGSGGMIVMDDTTCVVDVAKYFLSFLIAESCGKCVPCREGLYQLHALACAISEGRATEADLDKMEHLSEVIVTASLCGLGKSGPNPFLSTIRYFREEYLAHSRQALPGGVCRGLIRYEVDAEKCTGCMACIVACATHAVTGKKKEPHFIDQEKCDKCGACKAVCKYDAIRVI